jgi:SAM-dependent methyltransferase
MDIGLATQAFDAAKRALDSDDYQGAEELLRPLLSFDPSNLPALHLLVQGQLKRGRADLALERMLELVRVHPHQASLWMDLAHIYQLSGKVAQADDCYRKCLDLNPKDGLARELHSQSLLEQWMQAMENRKIGREASKSYAAKVYSGFVRTYLSGKNILDIGYRGGFGQATPIVSQAVGVDLGYPGYDGVHLPFENQSQDAVYTSHCLEHMDHPAAAIVEWFRVLKVGGYLIVTVPHQYLYERKRELPSKHPSHLHFFTPSKLLALFEGAVAPNLYRVRHLQDNDLFYDYSITPETHPVGCYEIELAMEKMLLPTWTLE